MVYVSVKFRENTSMRFRVTVQKLNMTDRQTDRRMDGGALQYLPSRAFGVAGDNEGSSHRHDGTSFIYKV